jgi:hypothetical protein
MDQRAGLVFVSGFKTLLFAGPENSTCPILASTIVTLFHFITHGCERKTARKVCVSEQWRSGRRAMPNGARAAKTVKLSLKVDKPCSPSPCKSVARKWSQWPGLNRRPTVYETVALPLSYIGVSTADIVCIAGLTVNPNGKQM